MNWRDTKIKIKKKSYQAVRDIHKMFHCQFNEIDYYKLQSLN